MKLFVKQTLSIMLAAFLLSALPGCGLPGGQNTPEDATPKDSIETPFAKAAKYYREERPFDEVMKQQLLAVQQLRDGHPQNDAVEILSQTGHFYMRHGDYVEALTYLQEASDSLKQRSMKTKRLDIAAIRLNGTLGALFTRVGLYDEALNANDLALEASAANGYEDASDIWRIRTAIYNDLLSIRPDKQREYIDSLLYAADMAEKVVARMQPSETDEIYRKRAKFVKGELFLSYHEQFTDSLGRATQYIQQALQKPRVQAESAKVLLGRAKVLRGNYAEGIALAEEGLEDFRREDDPEGEEWALVSLADIYVRAGQNDKLAKIYPQVSAIRDSMTNSAKLNAVVGADYRYRLKETKQKAERLAAEKKRASTVAVYEAIALVVGIILGAVAMWAGIKRLRKAKLEKERQQSIIDEILTKQQRLNATIEDLNEKLSIREPSEVVENAIINLNPSLLSGEDENEFRRAFTKLYPNFLKGLRADYQSLTPNDELVCMLIYLKTPSVDAALCLGISRASLNSARYRIRKKLALDKDTDLDVFIGNR